jgi:hypothetical protein
VFPLELGGVGLCDLYGLSKQVILWQNSRDFFFFFTLSLLLTAHLLPSAFSFAKFRQKATQNKWQQTPQREREKKKRGFCHIDF